jgi:hypothetical protein
VEVVEALTSCPISNLALCIEIWWNHMELYYIVIERYRDILYSDIYSESIEIHGDTEIHINIFREVLHTNIFSDGGGAGASSFFFRFCNFLSSAAVAGLSKRWRYPTQQFSWG